MVVFNVLKINNITMNREEYGNFNYGYVGAAFGLPKHLLLIGNVYAHYTSHHNFDDDPHDLELIEAGIDYYYKCNGIDR